MTKQSAVADPPASVTDPSASDKSTENPPATNEAPTVLKSEYDKLVTQVEDHKKRQSGADQRATVLEAQVTDANTRIATLEKTARLGKHAGFLTEEAIAGIMAARPAAFVISITDLPALMQPPRSRFADWLDQNYVHHGEFDGMHILILGRR